MIALLLLVSSWAVIVFVGYKSGFNDGKSLAADLAILYPVPSEWKKELSRARSRAKLGDRL